MDALIDTHTLLWWLTDDKKLTLRARKIMQETRNVILVSAASAWEITTKVRLNKLPTGVELAANFVSYIGRQGFEPLPISMSHAVRAGLLPGLHKDPFDRMLIAQAQEENIPIISNDVVFDSYGVRRIW